MQVFITANENAEDRKQIVPRMPQTSLSLEEFALIEKILTFRVGDLWVRVYDQGVLASSLSESEQATLKSLGDELLGATSYVTYSTTDQDLTEIEQLIADLQMKTFITDNRDNVETATIRLMPLTTLTKSEWNRIQELMDIKVNGGLFSKLLNSGLASLTDAERIELDLVGEEWIGGYWQQYAAGVFAFTTGAQAQVDSQSKDWIRANEGTGRRRELYNSRRFLKAIRPGRRSLAAATTVESNECATAQEIRDYLQDKSIVVYSARSFVKEDQEKGSNELITFLEPVADKRLDFKYHKRVEAVIQKQNIEIQDSYYQIF